MKTAIPYSATPAQEPFMKRFRKRFSVFFVFLIFSSLVWVVIKLSKDFTSTLTYKVDFKNVPEGRILASASDTMITVGVDAQGFNLIRYHFLKEKPVIELDLNSVNIQHDRGEEKGYLLLAGLTRKVASQIGSQRELVFISPDTIKFGFLPEYKRQIPVKHKISYQLRPQFMLYDSIQVQPDSIWIYGPQEILDTIQTIDTEQKSFPDLFEDQNFTLDLIKPGINLITLSENQATVTIKVEKFTEKAFELPISVLSPENDYVLRIFPEKAVVNCLVALKDYKRVDEAMFEAAVAYHPGEMQSSTKLRVELIKYPSFVRIARIEPARVEFILVKSTQ